MRGVWHVFVIFVLLQACGSATIESIRVPGVQSFDEASLSTSQNAFRTTLYPVVRQYCATCHGDNQSPYFASPDLIEAHDALVFGQKVDFNFPSESTLVRRLRDLRHSCWSPDCARDAQELTSAIEAWALALGEERPSSPYNITTVSNQIPFAIPSGVTIPNNGNATTATAELTFPIANLFQPAMNYAYLKIRIGLNDQATYLIGRPAIVASEAVRVEGLYLLVNGIYLPTNNVYTTVDMTVPANANPNFNTDNISINPASPFLLSTVMSLLPVSEGPGIDTLSLGFKALERAP